MNTTDEVVVRITVDEPNGRTEVEQLASRPAGRAARARLVRDVLGEAWRMMADHYGRRERSAVEESRTAFEQRGQQRFYCGHPGCPGHTSSSLACAIHEVPR
jgi:hypothetical protein